MTRQAKEVTDALTQAMSRRGFLGRLAKVASRAAGTAAAVLGGSLAASTAQAGKQNKKILCCWYIRPDFLEFTKCYRSRDTCPEQVKYGRLWGQYWGQTEVSDCKDCRIP